MGEQVWYDHMIMTDTVITKATRLVTEGRVERLASGYGCGLFKVDGDTGSYMVGVVRGQPEWFVCNCEWGRKAAHLGPCSHALAAQHTMEEQ